MRLIIVTNMLKSLVFYILFLGALFLQAQELPPIKNFSPLAYNGDNQNWSIAQGANGHMYIANNQNLLEYDGAQWTKHKSRSASTFRSVATNDSLIFTGQYMEFGFWKKNQFGKLNYTSIATTLGDKILEDEEFWNIVVLDNWVLFQSLDRIYSYNLTAKKFKISEVKSAKAHLFKLHQTVYYQNHNLGIYTIENGEPKQIANNKRIGNLNIVGIYEVKGQIIVILENGTFFQLKDGVLVPWQKRPALQVSNLIYSTGQLQDGSIILGTISNGMYQIGIEGEVVQKINQQTRLYNNTVLSVFEDRDKNLWLGLDNGLSVINMDSPFNEYKDSTGKLGQVYASIFFEDRLYLGTNQGLFVKTDSEESLFKMIPGTDGQVWSLTTIDKTLFCGHNKGTFIITGETARQISFLPGTWSVKKIPGRNDLLIQGNYDGLSILKNENSQWSLKNLIEGFSISSRFFEFLTNNKVVVNHEFKGLYQLTLDKDYTTVIEEKTHPTMGYGSSISMYQDQLLYTSSDGVFVQEKNDFSFSPDTTLIKLLFENAGGVKSIAIPDAESNRLWCFTPSGLSYLQPNTFNASFDLKTISIPSFFRGSLGVSGFENLSRVGNEKYVLGISDGFVVLNLDKIKEATYKIQLNEASHQRNLEPGTSMNLNTDPELDYGYNTVSFSFAVPQYDKYTEVNYQYRLEGLFEEWSAFTKENRATFSNLKFGTYTFQVRAKVGNTITENSASYSFTIKRPWYLSTLALLIYLLGLFILFYSVHKIYNNYYAKKQKRLLSLEKKKQKRRKLKDEKELIQLRNDKLRAEVEAKNRELAVATMSMIKKNEFLNRIKSQLQKASESKQIKSVIQTIDKNINNEDDWQFFEEAFNNADKNFMKKIKNAHPELTPSDLKLCAYLRLNLTTKEIAPLLNISAKSVEVKRHRLRKKMNLSRENTLTTYIMNL
jgi:DNA-binding CsgD family transcriptional regulator